MLFCRLPQGSYGIDSFFPSGDSVLICSAASIIASEYLSPWTQLGVYSHKSGFRLVSGLGQQQFSIAPLTGSATGWLVVRYVFRTHHQKASR